MFLDFDELTIRPVPEIRYGTKVLKGPSYGGDAPSISATYLYGRVLRKFERLEELRGYHVRKSAVSSEIC